jgi:uncharacterized YigZ family protein
MLFSDQYHEPKIIGKSNLRERGSRFLAFAIPVKSEEEIKIKLHELKVFYPDATHHCFAWVLNPDKSAQRFNDDGEPGNSAGRPILRAIMSADLTNVLVVVVRYFGGTLLGIPGLIQSYGEAAKNAIDASGRIEKFIEDEYFVSTEFAHEQEIHRMISRFQARVVASEYLEKVKYHLVVQRSKSNEFQKTVNDNYLLFLEKI